MEEPQHLVSKNPIIKYDDSLNLVTQDDGLYQTTFHQEENYQKSPRKQISLHDRKYPMLTREKNTHDRDAYYSYNENSNKFRDQELAESRPLRRKIAGKNNFFIQDRRLLTEKYFPEEKYFDDFYEDSFYGDLEMAYSEPVKTVQPNVETRQFNTLGSVSLSHHPPTIINKEKGSFLGGCLT